MPHKNLWIGMGHLGQDPDIRYTASGICVANLSVALSHKWKDENDEWQEKTTWIRVVAWRHLGERAGERLQKGDPVYIEGRLDQNEWEDQDGNTRKQIQVIATDLQPLHGRKNENDENGGGRSSSRGSSSSQRSSGNQKSPGSRQSGSSSNRGRTEYDPPPPEDEIPF